AAARPAAPTPSRPPPAAAEAIRPAPRRRSGAWPAAAPSSPCRRRGAAARRPPPGPAARSRAPGGRRPTPLAATAAPAPGASPAPPRQDQAGAEHLLEAPVGPGRGQGDRDAPGGAVPRAEERPTAPVPHHRELRLQLEGPARVVARQVPDVVEHHAKVEVVERPHDQGHVAEREARAGDPAGRRVERGGVAQGALQAEALVELDAELEVRAPEVGDGLEVVLPGRLGEAVDAEARR